MSFSEEKVDELLKHLPKLLEGTLLDDEIKSDYQTAKKYMLEQMEKDILQEMEASLWNFPESTESIGMEIFNLWFKAASQAAGQETEQMTIDENAGLKRSAERCGMLLPCQLLLKSYHDKWNSEEESL